MGRLHLYNSKETSSFLAEEKRRKVESLDGRGLGRGVLSWRLADVWGLREGAAPTTSRKTYRD